MEMLEEVLYRTEEERINQLIRLHADRKVEEARRLSRLPSLTPEQWCWFWKQEQSHEILASFDMDVSLIMCLCPREKVGGEDGDYPFSEGREAAFRYWLSVPDRITRVWKEAAAGQKN